MQEKKRMDLENRNDISELMYKLELSCAKMEQCAFDAINTTDHVMMDMQDVMVMLQQIVNAQAELSTAIAVCTPKIGEKDGQYLAQLAGSQTEHLTKLEGQLFKVIEAAVEANDAARCIEAGIAEQSENIAGLIEYSEKENLA